MQTQVFTKRFRNDARILERSWRRSSWSGSNLCLEMYLRRFSLRRRFSMEGHSWIMQNVLLPKVKFSDGLILLYVMYYPKKFGFWKLAVLHYEQWTILVPKAVIRMILSKNGKIFFIFSKKNCVISWFFKEDSTKCAAEFGKHH